MDGCVATGKTFEQVKENYDSALAFHLEGLENKEIPKEFSGDYEQNKEKNRGCIPSTRKRISLRNVK